MVDVDELVGFLISTRAIACAAICLVLSSRSSRLSLASLLVYGLLRALYWANSSYKCRGSYRWKSLYEFKSCKVLITGGSSGLGQSIVKTILEAFPNVTILNIDVKASLETNDRLTDYICDLRDTQKLTLILNDIKANHGGEIRLLINNAGVRSEYEGFKNLKSQDVHNVFAVNVMAPIKLIQELTPVEGGQEQCYVVNIASSLGILSAAKAAAYAASKAALIGFHRSYTFELESRGVPNIRTLLVVPGQLDTDMFSGFEPPRQFFAPVLNTEKVAQKIIDCVEVGMRGDLSVPLYAKFAYLLMAMPYSVQTIVRKMSKMDDCLPTGQPTDSIQ